MKKWVTAFLVFITLVSSLPANYTISFFQIGNLLSHYQEHSAEGHNHHFLSFLGDHYFGDHRDDGTHSHDDLPFQDHECLHFVTQCLYILPIPSVDVFRAPININPVLRIKRSQLVPSASFSGDIWHPPRV